MPKHKHIIQSGLILNYDCGNVRSMKSGNTTIYDIVNGYNGSIIGGAAYNTANGGCLIFDGVNDYINSGNVSVLGLTNGGTISIWVYIPSPFVGDDYPNIISKGGSAGWDTNGWSIYYFKSAAYNPGVSIRNGANIKNLQFPPRTANKFVNYTSTFGDGYLKYYVDGVLKAQVAVAVNPASNSDPVTIMRGPTGYYLGGRVSQAMIYNRTLTATEVLYNYNATKYRYRI